MKARLLLPLLFAVSALAQTTYTMTAPRFYCDMASHYPVSWFSQFQCRGIPLTDGSSFFLFSAGNIEGILGALDINPYGSHVTKSPGHPVPATFEFDFIAEDQNGVMHTGTAKATWHDSGPNWRGWHSPVLTSFSVTVQ